MEDHSSTSGWVFLLGGGAISWALKKQTCITSSTIKSEFVALAAAGNEAEWLRNLVYEIPLWPKPISTISIRCDSAATLAKAYSQVYNGKVAYRLELPPGSRIHPTFHVSLLRSSHENPNLSKLPLPMTYVDDIPILEPESKLDHRIIKRNGSIIQQVLVKWMGRDITESTWENQDEIYIPGAVDDLEDKVIAIKRGIDTGPMDSKPHRTTRLTRRPARYEE
nr:zinc finger, CCHC-type [Tanacetum cinerariifolium]